MPVYYASLNKNLVFLLVYKLTIWHLLHSRQVNKWKRVIPLVGTYILVLYVMWTYHDSTVNNHILLINLKICLCKQTRLCKWVPIYLITGATQLLYFENFDDDQNCATRASSKIDQNAKFDSISPDLKARRDPTVAQTYLNKILIYLFYYKTITLLL